MHLSHQIRSSHEEVEQVSPAEALKFLWLCKGAVNEHDQPREKGFLFFPDVMCHSRSGTHSYVNSFRVADIVFGPKVRCTYSYAETEND